MRKGPGLFFLNFFFLKRQHLLWKVRPDIKRKFCLKGLLVSLLLVLAFSPLSSAQTMNPRQPIALAADAKTLAAKGKKGKWKIRNGKTYYYDEKGKRVRGFQKIGGKTYYFNSKGVMQTGWQKIEGKLYCFSRRGVMKTSWKTIGGRRYYFNRKGVMQTGWRKIEGKLYYFGPHGALTTGWATINGKRYFLESDGAMHTGWLEENGKKYFFGIHGVLTTGWLTLDGKTYYFDNTGVMQTGWMKQNGSYYFFKADGTLDPSKTVDNSLYGDSTGTAKQKTERRAEAIVSMITTPNMTKEQKLRTCFDYVMKYTGRRPRTPHYYGMDWPVIYANDMFLSGSGNCFSYAAAFGFLAKACGYTEIYACNDTGHGWTEINGFIYDPEEYRNTAHKYYGTSYSNVPGYARGIQSYRYPGYGFMHVKI